MKISATKTSALLFVLPACLSAAPLSMDRAKWDMNPVTWKTDGTSLRTTGKNDLIHYDAPRCAHVRFSARVIPERTGTNDWSTIGITLKDDANHYWHLALVQAPDSLGAFHSFELAEMRDETWLAQGSDGLKVTKNFKKGKWEFGEAYDLSFDSTPRGITGTIKNAKGELLYEMGYQYPEPDANGVVNAVTCGRPAFHVKGGFCGRFQKPDGEWSVERPAAPAAQPPAYASDSFVPGVTDTATGYFRVVQKDGRWWVIDPLGRGTVLLGVDHVKYRGHYSERAKCSHYLEVNKVKYPNRADWEEDSLARLKKWGFNMLGSGCDASLKQRGLIHTKFLSIGDGLCWSGIAPEYYICPNEHRPCSAFPNVFHPEFPAWADFVARRTCAPNKNDPWLFGYFIDNELAWWGRGDLDTGLFNAVAALPETHTAKIAQQKFLKERGITGSVPASVKLDFLKLAADLYFRISSDAIRRYDPNHLVMGARFAGTGGAHPVVWEVSGKYCDVVTFNYYPWADLDRNVVFSDRGASASRVVDVFQRQYDYVKKPLLITEWSFPALDSGLPCTGGAGQRFYTQKERTQATELFARTMLAFPGLIGYSYFMWVDEPPEGISDSFPEDTNYGLINEKGEAYPELTAMFERLQRNIGRVRDEGIPKENKRATPNRGKTSAEFSAKLTKGIATYQRMGDEYIIRNRVGLELRGRIGGSRMFESVTLKGERLGEYTGMWHDTVNDSLLWHNAGQVTSAVWREEKGRGILRITCSDRPGSTRGIALTHDITVLSDKAWFLCDLVSAKNIGTQKIDMSAFYFRQYSPFATDKAGTKFKIAPNLWKAPTKDAWISAKTGAYFGGFTQASTVSLFAYHLMNNGKSQHPDAAFKPTKQLVMQPGEIYQPNGTMWMLALCGTGGLDAWQSVTNQFD